MSFKLDSIKNAVEGLATQVMPKNETEKRVHEAISNQNWGASSSLMHEIARDTFDYEKYPAITKLIWSALDAQGRNWRSVFKALSLLEFLVKNGSERIIEDCRDHMHRIRTLLNFSYQDGHIDRGSGVREKSRQLVDLLASNETIREERDKARRLRDKYVGVSNETAQSYSGGNSSSSSRYNDSFGSDSRAKGRYADSDTSSSYDRGDFGGSRPKKYSETAEHVEDEPTRHSDSAIKYGSSSFEEPEVESSKGKSGKINVKINAPKDAQKKDKSAAVPKAPKSTPAPAAAPVVDLLSTFDEPPSAPAPQPTNDFASFEAFSAPQPAFPPMPAQQTQSFQAFASFESPPVSLQQSTQSFPAQPFGAQPAAPFQAFSQPAAQPVMQPTFIQQTPMPMPFQAMQGGLGGQVKPMMNIPSQSVNSQEQFGEFKSHQNSQPSMSIQSTAPLHGSLQAKPLTMQQHNQNPQDMVSKLIDLGNLGKDMKHEEKKSTPASNSSVNDRSFVGLMDGFTKTPQPMGSGLSTGPTFGQGGTGYQMNTTPMMGAGTGMAQNANNMGNFGVGVSNMNAMMGSQQPTTQPTMVSPRQPFTPNYQQPMGMGMQQGSMGQGLPMGFSQQQYPMGQQGASMQYPPQSFPPQQQQPFYTPQQQAGMYGMGR